MRLAQGQKTSRYAVGHAVAICSSPKRASRETCGSNSTFRWTNRPFSLNRSISPTLIGTTAMSRQNQRQRCTSCPMSLARGRPAQIPTSVTIYGCWNPLLALAVKRLFLSPSELEDQRRVLDDISHEFCRCIRGEADALHCLVDKIVIPIMMQIVRALGEVVTAGRFGDRCAYAKIRHSGANNIGVNDVVAVF